MSLSNPILFGYHRLWRQLYYDHLIEGSDHQISITYAAPDAYYNAIHGTPTIDDAFHARLDTLEAQQHVRIGLFLHDGASAPANWHPDTAEDEHWWQIALPLEPSPLPEGFTMREFTPDDVILLDQFLAINAEANSLSPGTVETLRRNITTQRALPNRFFLGYADGVACATGSIGIVDGIAYLAEGGVRAEFRRRGFHKALVAARLHAVGTDARSAIMACLVDAASNRTAQGLGFTHIGTRRFFRRG